MSDSKTNQSNGTTSHKFAGALEGALFGARMVIVLAFVAITAFMLVMASQLEVDAGFKKQLPLEHPYMQTFLEYEDSFGGANRLLVALVDEDGDMFDAEYFAKLNQLTNDVFFIPGVNRASVRSIFTPNVRFVEIVEGGFAGGNVIPADFAPDSPGYAPTPEDFERIRSNIVKSGEIGRTVARDFSGAMVWAELMETNPETGEKIDYERVAAELERIRQEIETDQLDVHIIGFAKIVGDITEGAKSVVIFFGIAILLTAILLYLYSRSFKLTLLPLACSIIAVIWGLGVLKLLGFGIDPMNMLTPFLIFAIGVSHGVQMISGWKNAVIDGADSQSAARSTFRKLLAPGLIALLSDTVGFLAIIIINIRIIQEQAITAGIGVAIIILTNLLLLPVLLSYIRIGNLEAFRKKMARHESRLDGAWRGLAVFTKRGVALAAISIAIVIYALSWIKAGDMQIGDSQAGVPELRPDSRYNQDARIISNKFAVGVDQLTVIAETVPDACTEEPEVMETIDDFAWTMENVPGVQKVVTLPYIAKQVNAGWNEGNLRWRILPRNNFVMRQNLQNIETDTGLLNARCDAMPIMIFLDDHKATTIDRVVEAAENFNEEHAMRLGDDRREEITARFEEMASQGVDVPDVGEWLLRFRLATGNAGVMAASNEVVEQQQIPMLLYVYGAIILLCLITFRSIIGTLCIVLPLTLVSVMAYALMAFMGIGLKVNTLPVVALGVGIGVDYGIYIFSRFKHYLDSGQDMFPSYMQTLKETGKAVIFTALTLAVGVGTWLFSDLQFQADMGVLLAFMFLLNMVAAVILLPALATWLMRRK